MSSRLLIDFGVPRDTPGQVQKHRMVQVYENEIFEKNVFKASKWGGESTLLKRGWARFTNFKGDRLVPKSEYVEPQTVSLKDKKKRSSFTAAAALAAASQGANPTAPIHRRKSAIMIAEEATERRRAAEAEAAMEGGADPIDGDEVTDAEKAVEDVGADEIEDMAKYGDDTSDVESDEEDSEIQFWNPQCPEGYEWVTAWKINRIFVETAEEGWIYGNNIKHIIEMQKKFRSRTTPSGSFARRRVWYRIMAKVGVDPILPKPFTLPLRMACFFDTKESKESTFLLNAYENQRWSPILMSWGSKFPGHLLFHDPAAVTNGNGKQRVRHWSDLDALPPGFRWASDWTVDERPGITGEEGFLYAADFPVFYDSDGRVQLANSTTMNVRRRRWVRRMVPMKEHVRKEIDLDPMPLPALFPSSGLLRPLQGKHVRRGLHHVDVILVHGLVGDATDTFKGPIRLSAADTFWPAEFLLSDDKFTSVYGLPGASKMHLTQSVRTLVVEHGLFLDVLDPMWTMDNAVKLLSEALRGALVGCRPIVWIGHSIGGLLIKELLRQSFNSNDNSLFALTRGVVFLATPHHGASSINTILDMRIAKKSATTEYLKPRMHFHEMQAWFDETDIEYVNVVENCDIPSRHFSGVFASLLMKFVGLRIVQVNDGMLTMGAEPKADLNTPIRYNYLADLDHWSLGAMKLGNPVYDKVYSLVRLAVARWLRVKNDDSRTAWKVFSADVSKELFLLARLLYEIMRTNSPISRTLSVLEHKTNPNVIVHLMKSLTAGSPRQAKLETLSTIKDLDADSLDRIEDYLRERPPLDSLVGKYRIPIESQLCVLTESVDDAMERQQKWDELVQGYSTKFLALICTEDIENIKDVIVNDNERAARVGDMLFWIELGRCCKEILPLNGCSYPRDAMYSHEDIDDCMDVVHNRLLDAISGVNESVRASVETELNRPAAVVRASMYVNHNPELNGNESLPTYAPPPPPVPAMPPQFQIGEDDDDLEVVAVSVPKVPDMPPPEDEEDGAEPPPHSMGKLFLNNLEDSEHVIGEGSPMVMDSPVSIGNGSDRETPIAPDEEEASVGEPAPKHRHHIVVEEDDDDDLEIVAVKLSPLSDDEDMEISQA